MSSTLIYLITRLDGIKRFLTGLEVLSMITAGFMTVSAAIVYCEWVSHSKDYRDPIDENPWPVLKKFAITAACVLVAACIIDGLIPTTKEAAAIYAVPKVVDGETFDKLGEVGRNLTKMAVDWSREMTGVTTNNVK